MSESNPKDPVRIVYHAENRTFARLFNEHSLEDVKNVVRRKLGLGRDTDVSLKQMGADALLDLDDDDDFQAFRALVKSAASVDIRVMVGSSLGASAPPPPPPPPAPVTAEFAPLDEQQRGEQPLASTSTTLVASSSAVQPTRSEAESAPLGGVGERSETARAVDVFAAVTKTPEPSARKRKVSFDQAALSASIATKTPVSPKPVAAEEPPKKRLKKVTSTAKDVPATPGAESPAVLKSKTRKSAAPDGGNAGETTPAAESPAVKGLAAPKPKTRKPVASDGGETTPAVENLPANAVAPESKTKKSTASNQGNEAGPSEPKSAGTPEPPAKKPKKQKTDDSSATKKSSAPVDREDASQLISLPIDSVNPQPASENPGKTIAEGGVLKSRKSASKVTGTACAAIPRTSASASVQSEVAAAILSDYMSMTIPPPPLAKKKPVRRYTRKSLTSSSALPVEPTTVPDVAANGVPNAATDLTLEHAVPTDPPPQRTRESNGPPCPICLEEPFHIRYCCPIVLKGPSAIQERLEELKETNMGDQLQLIKELEGLLRDSKATAKPSLDAVPIDSAHTRDASRSHDTSLPGTPNIPSNSRVSEVTVESRDEGSSSESSDDVLEGASEHRDLSASKRQPSPGKGPSLANHDLEAVVRGPAPRQSVHEFLDVFLGGPEVEESDSDSEVEAELEEDSEDVADRLRRLSRHPKRYFISESEEEESRSPSRSEESVSNDLESVPQNSSKPLEESAEREQDDVVMKDVDPPVQGQGGDSSEETHVASEEDRMVVDHEFIGEKDVATIVGQQVSSPAPGITILPPSDAPREEPQESRESEVDPAPNRERTALLASDVPREVEADPIEPADDLEPLTVLHSSNADPIEAPSEDVGSLFTGAAQSTPKPGVAKRIKTRHGQVLEDEADHPILVEQLDLESLDVVTPLSTRARLRRKATEPSASQEPATTSTRRSTRLSSLPPPASTPVAVVLLNHRNKTGTRTGKATKTPTSVKRSEQSAVASQTPQFGNTPSLVRWEALAEPSSPSVAPDEPSVLLDELMSSSPPDNVPVRGRPRKVNTQTRGKSKDQPRKTAAPANGQDSSQGKERLFDLTPSQIPFPYSQHRNMNNGTTAAPLMVEETTDTEEEGSKVVKKKVTMPARYRSLSQLASEAVLHSPDLPTPATRSSTGGKTKKRVVEEDSSSSESDEDEAIGSQHIPRGRRAGSALEVKRRKSALSRI